MIKIYSYPKDNITNIFTHNYLDRQDINSQVSAIIKDIKERGDTALFEYTEKFDGVILNKENIKVSKQELANAASQVSPELLQAMRKAAQNVYNYHIKQKSKDNLHFDNGIAVGTLVRPLKRAGIYVPGGSAAYPSSVLMTAMVAKAAGVQEIIMCSPNLSNPLTLAAAQECGVQNIFKVGGAQAIAAMAYGTASIPKVDIIAGPGNIYVTLAKKQVFGQVKIDMVAGPSEIAIIADEAANAAFIAADMLGQAEHDTLSAAYLITNSKKLADKVKIELISQVKHLDRAAIINKSLQERSAIIIVKDMAAACSVANTIAPEHLEIICAQGEGLVADIHNAGAIFIGEYSPEALGDYFAGPSHVLPTSGSARYFEVLNTDTFSKKISYIKYNKQEFNKVAADIYRLANAEGFGAHVGSVKIRAPKEVE